jgi:hypothetical protein
MIDLRPILASEYGDFCSYFIGDYSQELELNYGYSQARKLYERIGYKITGYNMPKKLK